MISGQLPENKHVVFTIMTKLQPKGKGKIICELVSGKAEITNLSFNYPLRLMKPKTYSNIHQAVYVLSYGGGLLQNDIIELEVEVKEGTWLSILSQASTKVYKRTDDQAFAKQEMLATIGDNALLAILPEPITCFADSAYRQTQEFRMSSSSSLILLDWMTSGRSSRGECWEFEHYFSENRIFVDDRLALRDAWLLESQVDKVIYNRMMPYQCVSNLIMIGKLLQPAIDDAVSCNEEDVIYRNDGTKKPLIWSISKLDLQEGNTGIIIRVGAIDTITMRDFLTQRLATISDKLGNLFSRI